MFPRTLDPSVTYKPEDPIQQEEIIGLNPESRQNHINLLEVEMIIFDLDAPRTEKGLLRN